MINTETNTQEPLNSKNLGTMRRKCESCWRIFSPDCLQLSLLLNRHFSAAPSVFMILSSAVCAALRFTTVLLNHQSVLSSPELQLWCRNNLWKTNKLLWARPSSSSLKSSLIRWLIESIKLWVLLCDSQTSNYLVTSRGGWWMRR